MKIFYLPDLGEGLPDAIIREWYVKAGDVVKIDQPLASMETAKALVDVPSPIEGAIEQCFGNPGDTIETGQPLIGFVGEGEIATTRHARSSSGTVVGAIQEGGEMLESTAAPKAERESAGGRVKASPAIRRLAVELGVDLTTIRPKGPMITAEEVQQAAGQSAPQTQVAGDLIPLSPVKKAMVLSMTQSHRHVVPVSLMDDVDISAWKPGQDISVRLLRAIVAAVKAEPMLNVYFDGDKMAYHNNTAVNIGLAVDTAHGLYVPVLKDVANQSDASLREQINHFKQQAQTKSIHQDDLHGATIMLSNFGALAGRYATPILLPPMVAVIGVGKSRKEVVATDDGPAIHPVMPLSVTADHRAVTGGEIARFLHKMIQELSKED